MTKPSEVDLDRHVYGNPAASVTVVEYGDFECPYCAAAYPSLAEVCRRLGPRMRFVFRHFPIAEKHPRAELAAEAAEAAGAQGSFWEMHDKLLSHQDELEPRDLDHYADELGLDADRFWRDVHENAGAQRIARDVASADASGVAGTPSFFINGKRHQGAYDEATLGAAVRAARWRAQLPRAAQSA